MSCLGNLLWFIFGGCISGLSWMLAGCVWCISIIGIPYGVQCFKFASMSFFPFGKEIVYSGGAVSFLVNVIWILISACIVAVYTFNKQNFPRVRWGINSNHRAVEILQRAENTL